MEGQWSLWLQVSDGCSGTSRLSSWGEAGLAQSLSLGGGWDRWCLHGWGAQGLHGGTRMSTTTSAVQDWRAPLSLRPTAVALLLQAPGGGASLEKRGPLGKGSLGSGWRPPGPDARHGHSTQPQRNTWVPRTWAAPPGPGPPTVIGDGLARLILPASEMCESLLLLSGFPDTPVYSTRK